MARITRESMLMEMAAIVSKRGTCSRLQVGAVFAKDGRIVVSGYNGAPAGMPHCVHENPDDLSAPDHLLWLNRLGRFANRDDGCQVAEHAERNAIAFAARHGLALEGTDLFVTHMPCEACARSIINAGIEQVYYRLPYRITAGVELLRRGGIRVIDMSNHEG